MGFGEVAQITLTLAATAGYFANGLLGTFSGLVQKSCAQCRQARLQLRFGSTCLGLCCIEYAVTLGTGCVYQALGPEFSLQQAFQDVFVFHNSVLP